VLSFFSFIINFWYIFQKRVVRSKFDIYIFAIEVRANFEHISLWWSDTPFQSSWFRSGFPCSLWGSYWTKSSYWSSWSHHIGRLRSPSQLVNLYEIPVHMQVLQECCYI
jgi:hypothetical protein